MGAERREQRELLRPYLPRPAIQWLAEAPAERVREVDGSVVFVDISGFTKMSERLARRGKVGAEEVTDNLGAIFARMLSVAYGEDGSLLKFGGDALLILFDGEQHAERAVRSAHGMRALLREAGVLQTSAGKVVLRMSVGVHGGRFHFFLVGESHHEFMVCGPAASRVVDMEGTATAGEILLSPEIAAAMPSSVLGKPKGPGVLLRSSPGGLTIPAPPREIGFERADLASAIPLAVREHVLQGAVDPEHRTVTVAFIHYDGIDAMIWDEGAAAVGDGLHELVSDVQRAVDQHGVTFLGTDVDHDGGKIILIAGAPRATGDDEERMLLAVRQVIAGDRRIPVRIGVNRGPVFVGDVGPAYRRTYTVMGDAVNLAARVMAKAVPGQLLATASVLERSRTSFATEALEPFMVKGKAKPVQAYDVGELVRPEARQGDLTVEAGTKLPLVGRDEEAARLRAAFDASRRGDGWVVELAAEPGLGKSRLVEEVCDWAVAAGDEVVLTVLCEAYESSTPYFPFRGMLRDLLGIPESTRGEIAAERLRQRIESNAPHLQPWLPLLGIPLDLHIPDTPETAHLEDEFRKPRMEEVLSEFLALVLPTPTLLVIEDTHWMDDASTDLLRRLVDAIAGRPWMICTTRRVVDAERVALSRARVETIALEPLPADLSMALLGAATDESPISPHDMAVLAERSGGNPLFLRELLAATQAAGGIEDLPDSVEAVITAQIDRLSARDRSVLRYVSVLGQRFSERLARSALSGVIPGVGPEVWAPLSSFIVREADDTLRFSHGLVRDAAYGGLSYRRRRELHAAVAETIESSTDEPDDSAGLLSYHFFLADMPDRAWTYSRLAGDRAKSLYANVEAARFFQRALESAKKLSMAGRDVADVLAALGEVRERLGRYSEAADAFRSARKMLAGQPVAQAELMRKEAWLREAAGRFSDAVRWHVRGLALLEGMDGPGVAEARAEHLVGIASMRHAQGRFEESISWCHRAIEEAECADARRVVAHAAYLLDWLFDELGTPDEAPYPGLALKIYEELDDLSGQANVLNNLGMFAYFQGEWGEAIDLYEQGRRARLELGDEINAAYGTANVAEILVDQGRLEEAESRFRDALRVWRASAYRQGVAFAVANLGKIASRQGRFDEAVRLLEEAKKGFEEVGFSSYVLDADARLAENDVFSGKPAAAIERAQTAMRRAEAMGGMPVLAAILYRVRAYARLQLGDAAAAIEDATMSLHLARERNARFEVALGLEALARAREAAGTPVEPANDLERDSILQALGVIAMPEIPLPDRA